MRTNIRRTVAVPTLAVAALFGGATAANAVTPAPAPQAEAAAPQSEVATPAGAADSAAAQSSAAPSAYLTADGQQAVHGDYRQDFAATFAFPDADPAVQDYAQIYLNGEPSVVVPLQADGTVTIPVYLDMGHHFVGAVLLEDGLYPTDAVSALGFSVTAPLPGEPGSPVQ